MPLTVRAIINRGGEQAAQHSQALQAIFMHIPGLKVVMPSSPYDAKGLLISSIEDPDPVIYIDDRWLYDLTEDVPEGLYRVPIGKGKIPMPKAAIGAIQKTFFSLLLRFNVLAVFLTFFPILGFLDSILELISGSTW